MSRTAARLVGAVLLNVTALLLLGIGLVSPLTPSHGMPTARDLAIFAVGPVALLAAAFRYASPLWLRLFIAMEAALVLVALAFLLTKLAQTS